MFCPVARRRPCKKAPVSQDGAEEPEDKKQKRKTPLDYYMESLAELSGYTFSVVEVSSCPLPEKRERVWILGSRETTFPAEAWAERVRGLENHCKELPTHHLSTILQRSTAPFEPGERTWQQESSYHQTFSKLVQVCIDKGMVGPDVAPKRLEDRASRSLLKQACTPWQQANIDALEIVLDNYKKQVPQGESTLPCADISQTASFSTCSLFGTWTTLTTSTQIFNYATGQVEPPRTHFGILGWSKQVDLKGFANSELYEMCGNSMSIAAVMKVLLPLLVHLKCL